MLQGYKVFYWLVLSTWVGPNLRSGYKELGVLQLPLALQVKYVKVLQVAGLLWIQENVKQFGGDPNSITLIGHGTGANLASLLMVSPVAKAGNLKGGGCSSVAINPHNFLCAGLFKSAVLMSGTSLMPNAIVSDAGHVTTQVAAQLNCPLSDKDLIACLRNKEVQELLSVQVTEQLSSVTVTGLTVPKRPFMYQK